MTVQPAELLTNAQIAVLREIYYRFNRNSAWPTFQRISRDLRQRGTADANAIIQSIPEHFLARPRQGSIPLQPADRLRLTLRGMTEGGGAQDVELFLSVIRVFAATELRFTGDGSPEITSTMLAKQIEFDDEHQVARLFQILQCENFGALAFSGSEATWSVTIGPNIARFENVESLDDYLAARKAWEDEGREALLSHREPDSASGSLHGGASTEVAPYIHETVIASIQAKAPQSQWDCTKLVNLIVELNHNYELGHGYAVHALLRAIIDHIPPIFGAKNFQGLVNSYSWGQTDKQYMKKLLDYKLLGHDALHRQISSDVDILSVSDAPPRQWVNRLLQECVKQL